MKKELALASALLFSSGAVVEGVEQERLDVSPFLSAIREGVDYTSDPKFFKKMEKRATDNPDGYFTVQELPDGALTLYYPDGAGEADSVPRVGHRKTVNNILVDDIGGPLNAFATNEAIILDIDQDGSLGYEPTPDLLNWNQIQKGLSKYLIEPTQTQGLDWSYRDATSINPATLFKVTEDNPEEVHYIGGNQAGFLTVERFIVEIPKVGTDEAS